MPQLDIDDFSGGITDNYVAAQPNKSQVLDNYDLIPHGRKAKLRSRAGSELYDEDNPQLPSAEVRIGFIHYFKPLEKLIVGVERDLFYLTTSWQTITGPTGNKVFPAGVTKDYYVSLSSWNKHILYANDYYTNPGLFYLNASLVPTIITAGLPDLATSPVITPGANTGKSYVYTFAYYYTYTADTVVFEMIGPTTQVSVSSADAPQTNPNAISVIPVLANSTTTNYDTTSVKVKIYRTENAGTASYYVGQVTNGTTTYSDNTSDASLILNAVLYTEGGVSQNDPPPLCKFVHVTENNVAMYANIKDGAETKTNYFRLSKPGEIAHVPGDFEDKVDDEIVGVSSIKSRWIVPCTSSIWRVEGFWDAVGTGTVTKTKISDVTGCVSGQSIVQTVDGIFFAGDDQFYFTDGFRVLKVTEELNDSYAALNADDKKRIYGKYNPATKQIIWAVQTDSSNDDNDACWVLDLRWGVSPEMPFTTYSGGDSFAPSAIEFVNGDMIRGDRRGYLFRHDKDLLTDPKVDTGTTPEDWTTSTIVWTYKSPAFDFGIPSVRKFATRILLTLKNITNISVGISVTNDDGRKISELQPLRFRNNLEWGDPDLVWGDPLLVWDYQGLIIEQRRMPHGSLRCTYKQVEITNGLVPIVSSDDYGNVVADGTAKTVTLINAATYDWPVASEDYYIAFSSDDYVREYLVTARAANVLTYADSENRSPTSASIQWVLRGQPKSEVCHLISYALYYQVFGLTQDVYNKGESGEVA